MGFLGSFLNKAKALGSKALGAVSTLGGKFGDVAGKVGDLANRVAPTLSAINPQLGGIANAVRRVRTKREASPTRFQSAQAS